MLKYNFILEYKNLNTRDAGRAAARTIAYNRRQQKLGNMTQQQAIQSNADAITRAKQQSAPFLNRERRIPISSAAPGGGGTGSSPLANAARPQQQTPPPQQPATPSAPPAAGNGKKITRGAGMMASGVAGAAKNGLTGVKNFGQSATNGNVGYGKAAAIGAGVNVIKNWWQARRNGQKRGFFGTIKDALVGAGAGAGANMAARAYGRRV